MSFLKSISDFLSSAVNEETYSSIINSVKTDNFITPVSRVSQKESLFQNIPNNKTNSSTQHKVKNEQATVATHTETIKQNRELKKSTYIHKNEEDVVTETTKTTSKAHSSLPLKEQSLLQRKENAQKPLETIESSYNKRHNQSDISKLHDDFLQNAKNNSEDIKKNENGSFFFI